MSIVDARWLEHADACDGCYEGFMCWEGRRARWLQYLARRKRDGSAAHPPMAGTFLTAT